MVKTTFKYTLNREMKIKSCVDRFLDITMRFLKKKEFYFIEKGIEIIARIQHDTNTAPFTAKY